MLRVTPQPLPLALVRLISASRLAHPFALSPPALASAQRGFLQARSLVSARLATHRVLVSRTTRDVSEPVSATLYLTTSTRASWALDSSQRDLAIACANEEAMRFHDACSASADRLADLRGGRFLPQLVPCFHRATTSLATEPLTPLSRPRFFDGAFARIESSRTPRPRSPCLREKNTASATRDAFHRRVIAPAPWLPCESRD